MTTNHETPSFPTTTGHPALRATVILGLCAALIAGFVASSSRAPSAPVTPDTMACRAGANGQNAC